MKGIIAFLALTLISSSGCSQTSDDQSGVHPILLDIGQLEHRRADPDTPVDKEAIRLAVSRSAAIAISDMEYGSIMEQFDKLSTDEEFESHPEAVQMISGFALRYHLVAPNRSETISPYVASLISTHATSGGVMFDAMVESLETLEPFETKDVIDSLRNRITESFDRRSKGECSQCTEPDENLEINISKYQHLPEIVRERAVRSAISRRDAILKIQEWSTTE